MNDELFFHDIIGIMKEFDSQSKEKLIKMGLPKIFFTKVMSRWLVEESGVSYFYLDSIQSIIEFDWQEHLIKNGFLSIGSCPNGDIIAIKFGSGSDTTTVFISHEHDGLYGEGTPTWLRVTSSIDSFILSAEEDENYPCDYFEVEARQEKLKK